MRWAEEGAIKMYICIDLYFSFFWRMELGHTMNSDTMDNIA
jgi:hypothetical protein